MTGTENPPPAEAQKGSDHVARQRHFYDSRPHTALQPRAGDRYVDKLAARLVSTLGIESHHRVLEVGAGFGRFTFALLEHCGSVTALDLSGPALQALDRAREARGVEVERCRTVQTDLDAVSPGDLGAQHAFVVGFFVLHHLEDVAASLGRLAGFAAPGGALGFLEPNRWNPLYAAQVTCCPDMTWSEEKGVWQLSARGVAQSCRASGLEPQPVHRFGFFPPQLINRFAWARRLEARLERQAWLSGVLPFMILSARVPPHTAPASR